MREVFGSKDDDLFATENLAAGHNRAQ